MPATENTVYQIASVTKTFTATAINILVDEDKLKLDDKIVARLPDLPAAWKEVTVRASFCLTRPGSASYASVKDFFKMARKDSKRHKCLDLVSERPVGIHARRKVELQQHRLLSARAAHRESAHRENLRRFHGRSRIFKRLGMTHTREYQRPAEQ